MAAAGGGLRRHRQPPTWRTAGSLEATARALFVHPNTVRYRLRRATDVTGYAATDARDAFTLHIALVLGRLAADDPSTGNAREGIRRMIVSL